MKTNYEVNIIYNDLFKNESLGQALANLEKLEKISMDVFNRINVNLLDKKSRLENIKSRINRANVIIKGFENLPQALTIKSKRFYPNSENSELNNPSITRSIFYEDICDFQLLKRSTKHEINSKPANNSNKLGKRPDGTVEDVTLFQEILNTIMPIQDITYDIKNNSLVNKKNEISEDIDRFSSVFQYIDKSKIVGEKKSNFSLEPRESKILNSFMKKKQKVPKKPQDAPVSILEKVKMTKYTQKKDLIRRNTNTNINWNIPKNINLPLISDLDSNSLPLEDYLGEENDNDIYVPQGTLYNDDINDFHTPLDLIKNSKSKTIINTTGILNAPVNNTTNNNIDTIKANTNKEIQNNSSTIKTQTTKNEPTTHEINTNKTSNITTTQKPNPVPAVPIANNTNTKIPPVPKIIPKIPPAPKIPNLPKIEPLKAAEVQPKQESHGFLDEIGENPISRLKKVGTIYKPPEKKQENANNKPSDQASMLDLLKQQIGLRFNNIHKNSKPVKHKKKKKSNASESFSSKSNSD